MKTFQEIMFSDLPKTIDEFLMKNDSGTIRKNSELVAKLAENQLMTASALSRIARDIDTVDRLNELDENFELLKCYVDLNCFDSLLRVYSKTSQMVEDRFGMQTREYYYTNLLQNKKLFDYIEESGKLTSDFALSLLKKIERTDELYAFVELKPVVKYLLNNFLVDPFKTYEVLDVESIDENQYSDVGGWPDEPFTTEEFDISVFFDLNDDENLNDDEIEKYRKMYEFVNNRKSERARSELIEVLKDNEIAKNRLIEVIDNNLGSVFNITSLLQHLKQPENCILR